MFQYDLSLKQEQKLCLNMEMKLSLNILQMNVLELEKFIYDEVQNNFLLDIDEEDFVKKIEYFKNGNKDVYYELNDDEKTNVEIEDNQEKSLYDILKEQLRLIKLDNKKYLIGNYIIDNINEYGYLEISVKEIAKRLNVKENEVEEVVKIIQTFEPSGVGARDLKECLKIQLKNLNIDDPLIFMIIDKHLEDVAKNNFNKLSKSLKVDKDKLIEYVNIIKNLNPKPGASFISKKNYYVVPDVIVDFKDGELILDIYEKNIPSLRINKFYLQLLNEGSEIEKRFIKDNIKKAMAVIRAIDERRKTLEKIFFALVNQQKEYILGMKEKKPLTLKDLAYMTDLHESTISRALSNKFIQTPKGIILSKELLSKGINISYDNKISVSYIKSLIIDIIKNEDVNRPYSDMEISKILSQKGISISRRTVAKYREELNILPSNLRKKHKK
ncbi:RNA polymerase, sigma 54 subunit, RpoN/SigL [Caloramator fervidus]|uniref:RNA polymerase, sigma 54 subunit, RpoN/SigL n=1 Tax=Caloramator fervidus TaxID=29344 RepID=A0A1H5X9B5_9CLOT|nr:RNA polymerase factor sigma-54 [Caloramator fervidus]SEG08341.1 RNA polymerase, sigma 54 subunit, RpoN/SigL [Caloramator fervidus]